MINRMDELTAKLAAMRNALEAGGLAALRLRGVDWFAWATGGGSSVVILTDEAGIAEVLVTPSQAFVLTNSVEYERLQHEEIPAEYTVWAAPWHDGKARDDFVREASAGGPVASDRPVAGERALPDALVAAKRRLLPAEIERYRRLGALTASAVTEVLTAARPEWTERELAGATAEALWVRGIHPTLTLAGGERRLPLYGHLTPTSERLAGRAMLVVCARQHGLYANLTRFVHFRPPSVEEQDRYAAVALIEAAAWRATVPGASLGAVYAALVEAYANNGWPGAETRLHLGGTTGYLSREVVATPDEPALVEAASALAWNPSLAGAKIEDTILVGDGLEILTFDPVWPTVEVDGRPRPIAYQA